MAQFTQEEKDLWFSACISGDHSLVQTFLDQGFDPNLPDRGKSSGLSYAVGKHNNAIVGILVEALERKYQDDPGLLYSSLTDNGTIKLIRSLPHRLLRAIKKARDEHAASQIKNQDRSYWISCCKSDDNLDVVRAYLEQGFDPDTSNGLGDSSLRVAAQSNAGQVVDLLLTALERKYQNHPQLLHILLSRGNPLEEFLPDKCLEQQKRLEKAIADAKQGIVAPVPESAALAEVTAPEEKPKLSSREEIRKRFGLDKDDGKSWEQGF